MKKIQVAEIPECNAPECSSEGKYDVPTIHGPWGNFCVYHMAIYATKTAKDIGYELTTEEVEPAPRSAQLTQFADDLALEDDELAILMEDMGVTEEDLFG